MNGEEKNAIENIKALKILFEIDDKKDFEATPSVQKEIAKDLKTLLNLIKQLQKENEKLKTKLLNILEAQKVIKVETLSYIKENYITIQKVKDKIELLEEKAKYEQNAQVLVQLYKQIKVLQELLEGRE